MTRGYWYVAALLVGIVLTTLGSYAAPLAVVGLALGIFFGTVSMRGRRAAAPRSTIPRPTIPRPTAPSSALGSDASGSHPGL